MKGDLKKLIRNPFERIAGMKAFGIGIVIVMATVITGYFSHTLFPGVISVKLVPGLSLSFAMGTALLSLLATVIVLYVIARIQTRHVRFADILGTSTLARYPMFFAALPGFFTDISDGTRLRRSMEAGSYTLSELSGLLIPGLIMMLFSVLSLILLYRAFKVSSGLKGPRLGWSFALGLIAVEILVNTVAYYTF